MTTSLITGANRGIGLELAKQLRARGDRVVAVCRTSSPELDALGVTVEPGIDVSSAAASGELASRLAESRIDQLIANAGVLKPDSLEHLDFGDVLRQFEINALGALRTVHALLPQLHEGAKVALISSRMGSIADNSSGNFYGYRMSKAALNAAGVSLAHDLKSRGIAVAILHPGYVRTDMTGRQGGVAPADAARQLIARIDALTLQISGTFWHANGEVLPW
ncbi:MAG TPA: SDR family oxidoreductase [Polyangiales bacterium]|jgi:NAD(P)-dependent dehydrogenase (short-subunit alcohol dehydrogenase family)